mgnify:CR=1 FL=1
MFERKDGIVKNKKLFISPEYLRKVFDSNISQRNTKSKNINEDFKKIESIQKIDVSIEHPLVLFNKPKKDNTFGIENAIKKDLIEKNGYIDDGGFKKKLLKYYFYHNTEQNQPKNAPHLSKSNSKSKTHNQSSKRTSFSVGFNKRSIQKNYSNSIKKIGKRPNMSQKEEKERTNKLFFSVNLKDAKKKNLMIESLTDKNKIVKNLFRSFEKNSSNNKCIKIIDNNNKENKKEIDFKRKKEYLDKNNISYENINDDKNDNKNNNESKDTKAKAENKKIKNMFKNPLKRENFDNSDKKKNKKKYKDSVNQFEYLQKIRKELNILKRSKGFNDKVSTNN